MTIELQFYSFRANEKARNDCSSLAFPYDIYLLTLCNLMISYILLKKQLYSVILERKVVLGKWNEVLSIMFVFEFTPN